MAVHVGPATPPVDNGAELVDRHESTDRRRRQTQLPCCVLELEEQHEPRNGGQIRCSHRSDVAVARVPRVPPWPTTELCGMEDALWLGRAPALRSTVEVE